MARTLGYNSLLLVKVLRSCSEAASELLRRGSGSTFFALRRASRWCNFRPTWEEGVPGEKTSISGMGNAALGGGGAQGEKRPSVGGGAKAAYVGASAERLGSLRPLS